MLIHTGDATGQGYEKEVRSFAKWFEKQPAKERLFIPGNHELKFEKQLPMSELWFKEEAPTSHMMIFGEIELLGLKIFGASYTPWFHNWAFNVFRGEDILRYWSKIPEGLDILATHGPAYGILDEVLRVDGSPYEGPRYVGCEMLLQEILRAKPALHLFGHIHNWGGRQVHKNGTSFYNGSICDEIYMPTNPIHIIEYEKE